MEKKLKSALQNKIKGELIFPGDGDFDTARTLFYGGINRQPAVIIRVADANDVINAIKLARSTGLALAVRSGGHSFAGHSVCDDGIVVDLKNMRKLEIDGAEKTAWAEAGLTAGDVTNAVDQQDFVIGFGDTASVGIGGITLGGGVGFLVRKFGLTIDNLLAAEIVTADGRLLQVDAHNHPDLFWAMRGGGGNFGIATRFKFRLARLAQVFGGMLLLPATSAVIANFMALAEKAPDELSAIINIMPVPPMPFVPEAFHGRLAVMGLMMYAGNPQQGEKVMAPFRALAKPIVDMIKPMRYKEIFFPEDNSYHPTAVAKTMLMKSVNRQIAETILNGIKDSDAPMRAVQLRVLGGAMSNVPVEATAFAHRKSPIMCNVAAFYASEEEKNARQDWVEKVAKALYQGDDGAYVGFLGSGEEARIRAAYPGSTWKRLTEIKARYDPDNLFRLNHNIPPAKIDQAAAKKIKAQVS